MPYLVHEEQEEVEGPRRTQAQGSSPAHKLQRRPSFSSSSSLSLPQKASTVPSTGITIIISALLPAADVHYHHATTKGHPKAYLLDTDGPTTPLQMM